MYSVKQKNNKRNKLLIAGLVALLVIGIGAGAYMLLKADDPKVITTQDGQTVELKPATEAEKEQAEDNKNDIVTKEEQIKNNGTTGSKKTYGVVITYASGSTVNAYVNGVFEETGTCTATAKMGDQTVTKKSSGIENVSYTQCQPIDWDSSLSKGTWNITVAYDSSTGSGQATKTVEVK